MNRNVTAVLGAAVIGAIAAAATQSPHRGSIPRAALDIVARLQRADYEGNRGELHRLYAELAPLTKQTPIAARIYYWRGFALWRSVVNGANDGVDLESLDHDLESAVEDLKEAEGRDPPFVDARVARISCLQYLAFLHKREPARAGQLANEFTPLLARALAATPDNPRLIWVQGASMWYTAPGLSQSEVNDHQARALATYERGLRLARGATNPVGDSLDPMWGEPELLMSLAWANLNRTTPDLRAADDYARQALALVPYWHYVRDILMAQIRKAKETS